MKTKEEILEMYFDPYQTDYQTEWKDLQLAITLNPSLERIEQAMESYALQQIEKYRELIEWLNDECPAVSPPLEPYTTADLSHDFAEKLRTKLDDLKINLI